MFVEWKKRHRSQIEEFRFGLHLARRSSLTLFGVIVVLGLLVTAIFAPWIAPHPEDGIMMTTHPENRLSSPSLEHILGTDSLGRDILSMLIFGSRISVVIAALVVVLSGIIGIPLGLVAGYYGGNIDDLIMRVTDIVMSVPEILLAMLTIAVIGPGINNAIIAISLTHWTRYARLVRGDTLRAREETYVEAARAFGSGDLRIIFRHILPNVFAPLTVQASMDAGRAVLFATSLSFIGMGATPPSPEWGLMISMARSFIPSFWWYAFFPGVAIVTVVMGFSFLGDGLRDILDPKLRR